MSDDLYTIGPDKIGKNFVMGPGRQLWTVHSITPRAVLCVVYGTNEGVYFPHYEIVKLVDEYEEEMLMTMYY